MSCVFSFSSLNEILICGVYLLLRICTQIPFSLYQSSPDLCLAGKSRFPVVKDEGDDGLNEVAS